MTHHDVAADSTAELAAVLFDLDGTLVDTEPAWMTSERRLVEAHGGTWTNDDALGLVGNPLLVSAEQLRAAGVGLAAEEIVELLLDDVITSVRDRMPWRPGALDLITALAAANVPCALVTMSYRRLAQAVVDALPVPAFSVVVTGDEVHHGKPHPEPYLKATAALGVQPRHTVVIEDSVHGVASGEAAGCVVVAVPHYVSIPQRRGRTIVSSLSDLDVSALQRLVAELAPG